MANTLTGIFETLVVPAAIAAAQSPKYKTALLGQVYKDYRSQSGQVGQTLQINIPIVDTARVTNIGAGPIQPTDSQHTTVNLTIDYNESAAMAVKSFDQVRTIFDMRRLYVDSLIESLMRKVNGDIAGLLTAANFATNAEFQSDNATGDRFSRTDLAKAWANLQGQGTPDGDLYFVTSHLPYANMIGDASLNFVQESFVGEDAAVSAQQKAVIAPQFNAAVLYDQQMPLKSAGVFYALMAHRFAIAMGTVDQPASGDPSVQETTIFPKPDLPIRIQAFYDPMQQAHILHANCVFGLKVVRPEFGQLVYSQ